MAIEETRTTTDKTLLAAQYDDRMAEIPASTVVFRRVVDTGRRNAFGAIYERHPEPWAYTIRVTDVQQLVNLQAHALSVIVKEAFAQNQTPKTDAEVATIVNGLLDRGISFDHGRTQAWEALEKKRRAGDALAISFEVTEGKKHMEAAGLPVV